MKNKYILLLLLFVTFFVSSCIQEEAPNAECDIISVNTNHKWFEENKDIFNGEPTIGNDYITYIVKKDIEFNSIEITPDDIIDAFVLTPGARIEKQEKDIEKNERTGIYLYYTVYAEDGIWSKDYVVKFIKIPPFDTDHVFSFENYETPDKYNTWYEINRAGIRSDIWSSGNEGFKMTGRGKTPADFPTTTCETGFSGDCVKLTTCDTGAFGKMAGMPIAAGSIFVGEFDNANAMKAPLQATRFGLQIIPEGYRPVSLKGYYKYTAGETFTDKNKKPVADRKDECSIYAVVFEVDPNNFESLDGSDITSSDRIVLFANLENPGEPAEWTEFELPFEPMNGKIFDFNKLKNNEYAITVVASSSKSGAFFEGAIGSTLHIDELKIEWEKQ